MSNSNNLLLVLNFLSDFIKLFEVVTTWQTDDIVYELKPRFYLIYTRLLVHTILTLAYPKSYVYYMLLTYKMTLLFQNLLYLSVICDLCDYGL